MTEICITKPIVLIGMMGAGKSSLGSRLAKRLKLSFVDADSEIETAAGMSIAEIFETHGEAAFRDGERRVAALLAKIPQEAEADRDPEIVDVPVADRRSRDGDHQDQRHQVLLVDAGDAGDHLRHRRAEDDDKEVREYHRPEDDVDEQQML